jgi:hypothetical protein
VSDAQDVSAIQAYLKPTATQVSAAVASATLAPALKNEWYALSARILAFVSQAPPFGARDLATGRGLRTELAAYIVKLTTAGVPDLPDLIAKAPPQAPAPPPVGTPNPLFGELDNLRKLVPLALLAVVLFELGPLFKKGR